MLHRPRISSNELTRLQNLNALGTAPAWVTDRGSSQAKEVNSTQVVSLKSALFPHAGPSLTWEPQLVAGLVEAPLTGTHLPRWDNRVALLTYKKGVNAIYVAATMAMAIQQANGIYADIRFRAGPVYSPGNPKSMVKTLTHLLIKGAPFHPLPETARDFYFIGAWTVEVYLFLRAALLGFQRAFTDSFPGGTVLDSENKALSARRIMHHFQNEYLGWAGDLEPTAARAGMYRVIDIKTGRTLTDGASIPTDAAASHLVLVEKYHGDDPFYPAQKLWGVNAMIKLIHAVVHHPTAGVPALPAVAAVNAQAAVDALAGLIG